MRKDQTRRESTTRTGTTAVWGGEQTTWNTEHATHVPVVHSVSFEYDNFETWLAVSQQTSPGHVYSRNSNPTVAVFEEKMRQLEGGEAATSAATGMAAISSTLHALLEPGMRVVAIKDIYGGTSRILTEFLPRIGVVVELVDHDRRAISDALQSPCNVFYLESPTNPMLNIVDIGHAAELGHQKGATVVVDNTLASPVNQRPLQIGADLVVHSATKFLGGHGDALGGVVVGRRDLVDQVFAYREINGAALHASAAYLLIRGLKTLELRVHRQNENANRIAEYLASHQKVKTVLFPGLASHPDHEIAARQMSGFGGLLSFDLDGDMNAVRRFCQALTLAHASASLGAVESMIGIPATSSHVECTAEQRKQIGLPESLIRYSAGIENIEDLLDDFDHALEQV